MKTPPRKEASTIQPLCRKNARLEPSGIMATIGERR
jgi:hypothetical protein